MAWTLVDSDTAAFADGNGGHSFDLGTSPQAGDIDVLFVNSDTTVSTPSGWTLPTNGGQVNNQGAYGFYRIATGSEGSTVTITTSGNFNAVAGWSRWRGGEAFEVAVGAQINGTTGAVTPSIDTGTLTMTGELVVVAALLHRLASPEPTTPVWSSGYTGLTSVTQGTGNPGVVQFVGYKTNAGTAAETPSCSWTNGAFDRYAIALVFQPNTDQNISIGRATETDTAQLLAVSKNPAIARAVETDIGRPLTLSKTAALGKATETDTARTVTVSKNLTVGLASETDTARPLTVSKTVTLGRATETDTASALTISHALTIGRASETSEARTVTVTKTRSLGRASETDTARTVTVTGGAPPPSLYRLGGSLLNTDVLGGSLI